MLRTHSIGSNMTFAELIARQHVTFFTNWYDSENFPNIYGCGILIPTLDTNKKQLLYLCGNYSYGGLYTVDTGTMTWNKLDNNP